MAVKLAITNRRFPDSSALEMINYDASLHILEARFINGHTYQYKKVPVSKWEAFIKLIDGGGSAGEFINTEIKPYFLYEQVD